MQSARGLRQNRRLGGLQAEIAAERVRYPTSFLKPQLHTLKSGLAPVETSRIAELLRPFLAAPDGSLPLSQSQLADISIYINILMRWNARINLTAVRTPEEIVTRHFGESLFAAQQLFPDAGRDVGAKGSSHLIDIGSGAGFPGLPIKLWAPRIRVTLIESNQRKATFLREVVRAITLTDVNVFSGRAESFSGPLGDVVTLRAVERFEHALPTAAKLVRSGRLGLLIGAAQVARAKEILPKVRWDEPLEIPQSARRVFLAAWCE